MATSFSGFFEEFLNRKAKDINFVNSFTPDYLSVFLSDLIMESREMLRDLVVEISGSDANKMEDVTESSRSIYEYNFTGTSDTRVLNPPPATNSQFYVQLNGIPHADFSFNESNNEMTINNAPDGDNSVYIGAYFDGQFNNSLNLTERGLILDFMQLAYIDTQVVKEKLLNQRVYGKDYGMHSQAAHIKSMESLYDMKYRRLYQRVMMYTYRQDPDELRRLGGNNDLLTNS